MHISRALVTTSLTAGTVALSALVAPGVAAADHHEDLGTTTVTLNPDLLEVLVDTLMVMPIEPAMLSADGGVVQVSFPITALEGDEIEHSGGLAFTPVGGGSLEVTEFEVEITDEEISADKTWLNGEELGEVDIFDLVAPEPIEGEPACDGIQAGLVLTSEAAGALGAPEFTGAWVGNACVVPME